MISLFKKNIPGSGFDAFGHPVKYRSAKEAGAVNLMPKNGLVFYAPLTNTDGFNVTGNPQITQVGNIPCMYFDGNTYLETTAAGLPQGNGPRSASLWYSISPDGWNTGMVSYGTYTSNQMYGVGCDPYDDRGFSVWGHGNDVYSGILPEDNTFYHAVVTFNGVETTKFYLNGEFWEEGTHEKSLNTIGTSICIGSEVEGNSLFVGHLAAVRVYNRVLTEAEIKILSGEFAL